MYDIVGLLRAIVFLAVVGAVVYLGATVELGQRTLFGHLLNIWASDEAQEMVDGIQEASGPLVERLSRGVQAGVEEAGRELPDAGVP